MYTIIIYVVEKIRLWFTARAEPICSLHFKLFFFYVVACATTVLTRFVCAPSEEKKQLEHRSTSTTTKIHSLRHYHFAPGWFSGVKGRFHFMGAPGHGGNSWLTSISAKEVSFSQTNLGRCVCLCFNSSACISGWFVAIADLKCEAPSLFKSGLLLPGEPRRGVSVLPAWMGVFDMTDILEGCLRTSRE